MRSACTAMSPSSRLGRNSLPIGSPREAGEDERRRPADPRRGGGAAPTAAPARRRALAPHHRSPFSLTLPATKSATAAGTKVTDRTMAPSSAAEHRERHRWNIFPSMPVSVRIGRYTIMMMSWPNMGARRHLPGRGEDDLEALRPGEHSPQAVLASASADAVLDDDDRAVDDDAEVERAQAQQVAAHLGAHHAGDREQHRQRDDEGGDERRADVPEEHGRDAMTSSAPSSRLFSTVSMVASTSVVRS